MENQSFLKRSPRRNYEFLYGVNPIYSVLTINSGRRKVYEIILSKSRKRFPKIKEIISEALKNSISVAEMESDKFSSLFKDHFTSSDPTSSTSIQGIAARVSSYNYYSFEQYLNNDIARDSKIIVLDGVTDVGNFGSIIRNCSAFGFDGIIIPKNRSVDVNKRVSKISAGALEEVRIFKVINIVRILKQLKERGFWIYGTTLDKTQKVKDAGEVEFIFPLAVVFGNEDRGISRLVGKNCDIMVTINTAGTAQSLNVSVASGILLYIIQEYKTKDQE